MSRRSGFSGLATTMAQVAARREREQKKHELQYATSNRTRAQHNVKLRTQANKEEKQQYLEGLIQETKDLNKASRS